jgi:predicted nucleotidyltransferase
MAEAVFGSAARDDTDSMSDRDILIVDRDTCTLRERTRELEADGWSVASYTFIKLEALAARGALFVQHLKLESRILADTDGLLEKLLRSFEPRKSYELELVENARLAHIAATIPIGPRGGLLAADILYVAVRNFGVLKLAERGVHLYSYHHILEALESEKLLGANGSSGLRVLRFLKCLYRSGEEDGSDRVLALLNRSLSYLPRLAFPASVALKAPSGILSEPAPGEPASAYLVLRDLERRFVALTLLDPDASADGELGRLSSWIANPRAYASISSRVAPLLREVMNARIGRVLANTEPRTSIAFR